jgi:serine/threonine-protein kinase
MAEVYLVALQARGGVTKLAVLKRIWPELASDPNFAAMFLDEAKLAVRLNHPNVVQTYEVFSQGDELALAMEYLEGQTLTRALSRVYRELTLAQRLRIVSDVLTGLDYAHNLCGYDDKPLGVVHRDVGPQNIFLTYAGHVKVMDFGVAKSLEGSHRTQPGCMKGRLAYMAPEQLRGEEHVDGRADVYAAGVLLWELLAGRRMWQGRTEAEIARALREDVGPFPLPIEAGLPSSFDYVCQKALAPRPEDRFANAAELENELARLVPAVAESHARDLSRILSASFAAERAERQALIDASLRKLAHPSPVAAPTPPPVVMPPAPITAEPTRRSSKRAVGVGMGLAAAAALVVGIFMTKHVPREQAPLAAVAVAKVAEPATARTKPRAAEPLPATTMVPPVRAEAPRVAAPLPVAAPEEPPSLEDEADSVAEERPTERHSGWGRARRKKRMAAGRHASSDDDWALPEAREPRTLAKPLDTGDPYAQ